MEHNDLVEFGEKGLRSFGLVLHVRGTSKNLKPSENKNILIYDNKALLFLLKQVTVENTKDFLEYLNSLDEKKLETILSKEQIIEIKKLLNIKSLKYVSEKLRNLKSTLQENETLHDLLDGKPKEPYTIPTLKVCCH